MSPLAEAAADYLALRRALGFKLAEAGQLLPRFVAHLDAAGTEVVTVANALAWSASLGSDVAGRLAAIRGFARYLQALDPAHEVPPCGLVANRKRRAVPHLYSEDEVVALMAAARRLGPPLRAATTEAVIGLLAVSGMRVGEVLALDLGDVDWASGVLTVRAAKFNKARLVPLSSSALAALDRYAAPGSAGATTPCWSPACRPGFGSPSSPPFGAATWSSGSGPTCAVTERGARSASPR